MSQYDTSITLAENIKKTVAAHLQAVRNPFELTGEYHREKNALIQVITDSVVRSLEARHNVSKDVLKLAGEHVVEGVDKVIGENKQVL